MNKRWPLILFFALAAGLLSGCAAAGLFKTEPTATPLPPVENTQTITAEGRIVPLRFAVLAFPVGGDLTALPALEGAAVKTGDLLAALGNRDQAEGALANARLEQTSAQQALDDLRRTAALGQGQAQVELAAAQQALVQARRTLNDLDTQTFRDDVDEKEKTVQDKKTTLDDKKKELDKYQNLALDNPTRKSAQTAYDDALQAYNNAVYDRDLLKNQLDRANAAVEAAQARVDEAQKGMERRANGPDADQLRLAQARVDAAGAAVKAAEGVLAQYDLTAPFDGSVADTANLALGNYIAPGRAVITLADFSALYVETKDLTELDVVGVRVGQKSVITPDALPDLRLNGTVESIKPVYGERSGDVIYTVRIRLEDGDPQLRWGMTVKVTMEKEK